MMFVFGGCSESEHGVDPNDGKIAVSFSLPAIGVESSAGSASVASLDTRAGKPVPFDENVTVRIVAYKRTGPLADLSSDSYVDEATYIAVKEGSQIVLKPCTMSFDADTGRIDPSGIKTEGASPLRLMAGTYDFYAITPALALEKDATDGSTLAVPAKVSVHHGDDFASSLTGEVEVLSDGSVRQPDPANVGSKKTQTGGKVELIILDRKCCKLNFSITRKAENVTKVAIKEVTLSKIAHSPVESTLSQAALSIGTNDGKHEIPKANFIKGKEDYQFSVADEVLPKSSASFDLKMGITFNDAADTTKLATTIPAMAFSAGLRYSFDLLVRGGAIVLLLQITPWETPADWSYTDLGGYPSTSIEIGKWENVTWEWSTDVGGYPVMIPSVEDWASNPEWSTELGAYLSFVSEVYDWGDKYDWGTSFQ